MTACISADSHITEPPETYIDNIDASFRDRAPRLEPLEGVGACFVIEGRSSPSPMGLVAAAGKPADEIRVMGVRFEEMHRGGWDPAARLDDQDRDGVVAEIIYPTVGMVLCNHPDPEFKRACFQAYNRWLEGYCGHSPARLLGIGQTALRSPSEGADDLRDIAAAGFHGAMLPGDSPYEHDYDHPDWAPLWEAAIELELPLSFHILTGQSDSLGNHRPRGPKLNSFMSIIRGCQDIMGTLVFGGVFERHPELRVVCVEADAGWVPHYMYRMDHAFDRHRHWLTGTELSRRPSEYFAENIYVTFQDDWAAFKVTDLMNVERLMWANDFPHSDSTWPWSQELLAEHTAHLSHDDRTRILQGNVTALYGLDRLVE